MLSLGLWYGMQLWGLKLGAKEFFMSLKVPQSMVVQSVRVWVGGWMCACMHVCVVHTGTGWESLRPKAKNIRKFLPALLNAVHC